MPDATISTEYSDPIQLESIEGAYVTLRPLPYGKKMERRDKASKMYMEFQEKQGKSVSQEELGRVSIEFLNRWASAYDFSYCIGDHNLTDKEGKQLDLSNPMTLDVLNPRVGTELETLLAKLNGDEGDESLEDFFSRRSTRSEESQPPTSQQTKRDSES